MLLVEDEGRLVKDRDRMGDSWASTAALSFASSKVSYSQTDISILTLQ